MQRWNILSANFLHYTKLANVPHALRVYVQLIIGKIYVYNSSVSFDINFLG